MTEFNHPSEEEWDGDRVPDASCAKPRACRTCPWTTGKKPLPLDGETITRTLRATHEARSIHHCHSAHQFACAGHLRFIENQGVGPEFSSLRFALGLGLYQPDQMPGEDVRVFGSFEEMIAAHEDARTQHPLKTNPLPD